MLMLFREKGLEFTGRKEVMGLRDVDHALAGHIALSLKGLFVTEENTHNRAFANFIKRPPQDQVLVGHFEDLRDMVRSIRQARAGRVSEKGNKFANPDALPLINLTRTFDLEYGYTERQLSRDDYAELVTNDVTTFVIAALPATLTYNMTLLTADKESLSMLCNYFAAQFYAMSSTKIIAKTRLVGFDMEVECALNNLKAMMTSDVSLPISEERLFGAQISLTLIADTFVAHEVEEITHRIQVGYKVMDEHQPFERPRNVIPGFKG